MFESENILEEFYKVVASGKRNKIPHVHIPRSDVFYVRAAIEAKTGVRYSLAHVEWAMMKEGHLSPKDCFDGDNRMNWEEFKNV